MRVAIIGAGTAGVSVLREMVKYEKFKDWYVDVYDTPKNMGKGVPFQNDSDQLLINLPAKEMSINIENQREFFDWYQQQNVFKFDNPEYLPRFIFGHYMKSYLNYYLNQFDNINKISEKVEEVFINSDIGNTQVSYSVCTSMDMTSCRTYDCVFLTIGTLSYHDPYNLKGTSGYIQTPYPTYNTLDEVKDTDNIAVIGTGLASLDVIRYVAEHHPNLPLTVTSRSAKLPRVRGNMPELQFQYITPENFNTIKKRHFGNMPLTEAIALFKQECAHFGISLTELLSKENRTHVEQLQFDLTHAEELGTLQSLLEGIKENMNWIWNSFNRQDQEQFLNHYQHILKENSNPMPPRTAELLIAEIENHNIVIKANLQNITYDGQHFCISYGEDKNNCEYYDVIINATGSKSHLSELDGDDQLVLNLENRQVIQAHPLGGIQIVPETNQVISPRYGTLHHMFALGQLTNGINQSRNGVNMIVKQAVDVVKLLLQQSKA
ncbi:FAD/NAD(P)-binding protein [Staphylococcus arlettae]|uniref:FAD/NAD(P)-binding protein n=1 Tax=Staphylococcus arlettae TaxID=29378 RepID=UPI003A8F7594